ncbi:hypothetical protein ACP70R_043967 [Stipagrostis hirtigluma subsp. patula]
MASMPKPQIVLLKEGRDASRARAAQVANTLKAARKVADLVRATLGPDRLLAIHDDEGTATTSNNGATILRLLERDHPNCVDLAKSWYPEEGSDTPSSAATTKDKAPGRKERPKKTGDGVVFRTTDQEMIVANKEMEVKAKQVEESRSMELKSIEERKIAVEEEKLRILGEEARVKKMEQEYKIMFMDKSGLDDTQRAYLKTMRAQIIGSKMGGSGGGSA